MKKITPAVSPTDDYPTSSPSLPMELGRNREIVNAWRRRSLAPRFNLSTMETHPISRGQHAHESDVSPNLDHHHFPYQQHESLDLKMFVGPYATDFLKSKAFIDIVEALRSEGNYFLSCPVLGQLFWSTHPTNTEIDLYYLESEYSLSPDAKLPSYQHSVISMVSLSHDLSIHSYQILPFESMTFNANHLMRLVNQINANMIINLQKLCLIITLPDDVDPQSFYQLYLNCIDEFRWLNANTSPDVNLPDIRVLSKGKLNTRWTPTLLEDSVAVTREDKIIIKARLELLGKEEYEDVLEEYEKLLREDHIEITTLKASVNDSYDTELYQFDHFDLLYGALSYSSLCAFCQYLTRLESQLSRLSKGIFSVLQRFSEANLPLPANLTELGELIRNSQETKNHTLSQMKALIEAYNPLLSKAMFELNIPGNKSKSLEVQEQYFNKEIRKILLKSKPTQALIDWFDRSCKNTRYLLNFLMADVGNQILDQQIRMPKKHQMICRVIAEKWQRSNENMLAMASRCQ